MANHLSSAISSVMPLRSNKYQNAHLDLRYVLRLLVQLFRRHRASDGARERVNNESLASNAT